MVQVGDRIRTVGEVAGWPGIENGTVGTVSEIGAANDGGVYATIPGIDHSVYLYEREYQPLFDGESNYQTFVLDLNDPVLFSIATFLRNHIG